MSATPNIITVIGNLTADPEVRNANGAKVANISIASTARKFDRDKNEWTDKPTVFYRASGWRSTADNIEASLHKGDRVIALVEAVPNSYEKDGVTINTVQYEILEIAASLEFATVAISKATRSSNGGGQSAPAAAAAAPAAAVSAPDADADFS